MKTINKRWETKAKNQNPRLAKADTKTEEAMRQMQNKSEETQPTLKQNIFHNKIPKRGLWSPKGVNNNKIPEGVLKQC